MEKGKAVQPDQARWEPHPQLKDVKVSYFLSHKDDQTDLTCLLVRSPKGSRIEKHVHENSDDIIFVVKGKATMWIDGLGDSSMVPGSFFRIPKGVLHHPHDIEEDLLIYDVFYPYLA
jgi:quercetin dioxygenase-like cupin family protein